MILQRKDLHLRSRGYEPRELLLLHSARQSQDSAWHATDNRKIPLKVSIEHDVTYVTTVGGVYERVC